MNNNNNFKKLVRNLRTKKNDAFIHIGNLADLAKGKEGKKRNLRSKKDSDTGQEPHGEVLSD